MTRFVVDCGVVLRLAAEEIAVAAEHELLAPTLLRSQTLSALHEAVHRGEVDADAARERLERAGRIKIRLLGDAVLRRRAWAIADALGWAETYAAEYVALTVLQGDALVTLDAGFARGRGPRRDGADRRAAAPLSGRRGVSPSRPTGPAATRARPPGR